MKSKTEKSDHNQDKMTSIKSDNMEALQIIIDNLPFYTWYKDMDGRYLAVNNSFAEYTGMSKEQILGKTDYDLYPEVEAKIYQASDQAVIKDQSQEFFESIVNGKWKEEYKRPVYDKKGNIIGTTGFSRDISVRKSVENELKESERSKAVLLSNLPGVAYRCLNDKDWTMTFLSDGCFELTGYFPEELLGNKLISYNELISPETREHIYDKWTADIEANKKSSDEYKIITRSGEAKWVWDLSVGVLDKEGKLTESEGFILDITEIKKAEEALNESEDRFRTVFEEAPLGIGIFDTNTGMVYQLNKKFGEIVGRSVQELLTLDWKAYSHPDEIQENLDKHALLKEKKINSFSMNKRYFKPDGSTVWVNMTVVPFKAETIKDMHICMIEDITEGKRWEQEITYLSYHDILTGLYNRTFFEEEQKRFNLSRKLPISVIMGDVNGLKLINDSFGHSEGDVLLKEMAKILKSCCRGEDIIARVGGDEFVILLSQTDAKGAEELCKRIHKACKNYEKNNMRKTFYLSISLGHATKVQDDQTIEELLREAESMLYKKKNPERKKVRNAIIQAVKNELIMKCFESKSHFDRLLTLTEQLGENLSFSPNRLKELQLLGELHDIGKLTLRTTIQTGDISKLSQDEIVEYKRHTETGYRIALAVPEIKNIAEEILYHHEHWNGTGYPKGLKGEEIPLLSRVICVIDAYDEFIKRVKAKGEKAFISPRDYIIANSGTLFDPKIAKVFAAMIAER
jgi:diguanylate cyclase (GGDEF)-like protein/PAS domain S-box-containing protein